MFSWHSTADYLFTIYLCCVCILLLTCILFLCIYTLFCWASTKIQIRKREWVSECVFVISFSNFITSTEINLSNYGNIVVQPVVCYRSMVMASSTLLHHIDVYIFEYWANGERVCLVCDVFGMVRFSVLLWIRDAFLCYLLKMCIFHFVGINREPVSTDNQLLILMIAHLILIKDFFFFCFFLEPFLPSDIRDGQMTATGYIK